MLRLIRKYFTRALFISSLAIITNQLWGQIQHINFRHYSLADGLSSYKVVKVLQDRFGFMWIATQDGLNRFDGKGMLIYNKSAEGRHLLTGNDITDILEDTARNVLWVISSYGGLNGIDLITGNVKYSIPVADSANRFNHDWLKCITLFKNELWIGTYDGIAIFNPGEGRFKTKVTIPFTKQNNLDFNIDQFYTDEYDRVWVFITNYGLAVYSGLDHSVISSYDLSSFRLPQKYQTKRFNCCDQIKRGQMMLATHWGIKTISYNNTPSLKIKDEKITDANDKEIRTLTHDRDNNLWFATGDGLFKYNPDKRNAVRIKDVNQTDQKKWLNSTNSIYFDNGNKLWIGTLLGFMLASTGNAIF